MFCGLLALLLPRLLEAAEFGITLDRTDGGKLGIQMESKGKKAGLVTNVSGGLLGAWNEHNPHLEVRNGDRLVEVNRVRGEISDLVKELAKEMVLQVRFRWRPEHEPNNAADAVKSPDALQAWLDKSAPGALNAPDSTGNRLTHWAASGGHLEVLEMLVQKGAAAWDGSASLEEQSPLHMACFSGHAPILQYLLSEPLLKARLHGASTIEEAINAKDKKGLPCLHLAATAGHVEVITAMVGRRADIHSTHFRGTALHAAAAIGQLEAVEALLELGADPCQKNSRGETPRARAKEEEMDDVLEVLAPKEKLFGCEEKPKKKGKGKHEL